MKKLLILLILLLFSHIYSNAQCLSWVNGIGGTSVDVGNSIAVDGSGNVYITGNYQGTADFDPGAGTTNLISNGNSDIYFAKYASDGSLLWAKNIGGTADDVGYSIAVDGSGNVYITGNYQSTADFDPGAGTTNLTSNGTFDIFFVKYASDGSLLWAKSIGGTADDIGYSIAVDGSGNVYITGNYQSTADFDPGAGTTNLTSNGGTDVFFAKYFGSDGSLVWAKSIGGTSTDIGNSVAVDGSGNIFVTGSYAGTVDFDPGAGTTNLISISGSDIFYAKYSGSDGSVIRAKGIGGTAVDIGNSITVDGSGNVYVSGYFTGTADFDPDAGTTNLISNGGIDIFFVKYSGTDGSFIWAKSIGGSFMDIGYSITVDGSGNVYLTGSYRGTVDFDPGAGTTNLISNGNNNDIFFAEYASDGSLLWVKSIGGTTFDNGKSIAVDGSGNVYLTGYYQGTADFDPGSGTTNLISNGSNDIFFAKYTSASLSALTTAAISNILSSSATGGGNVTSDGGAAITVRGICWNTGGTPTTSDYSATVSGTTGTFTANLSGLNPGTTYYVRAFAANCAGTSYGSHVSFTTAAVVTPTMTEWALIILGISAAGLGGWFVLRRFI